MFRLLARLVALVLSSAFVICAVLSIFLRAAGPRISQPAVYKDAFAKNDFYNQILPLAAGITTRELRRDERTDSDQNDASGDSPANLLLQLSQADRNTMFRAVISDAYVRQQTDGALDQFFGWLHSSAPVPIVTIDLGDVKRRITAPGTEETFVRILQSKPPCTESQLEAGGIPVDCCPPAEAMPQVRQAFQAMAQQTAQQMPGAIDLFKVLAAHSATGNSLQRLPDARAPLARFEWMVSWSPVVSAALLLLIAAFAARSFRGWMWWLGFPCLIAGVAGAGIALTAVPLAHWIDACFVAPRFPADATSDQLAALSGVVTTIVQSVMDAALRSALALAIAGFVAVILGAFLRLPAKSAADGTR
jgi:hypothetical protein